jgi:hypothetical protein
MDVDRVVVDSSSGRGSSLRLMMASRTFLQDGRVEGVTLRRPSRRTRYDEGIRRARRDVANSELCLKLKIIR